MIPSMAALGPAPQAPATIQYWHAEPPPSYIAELMASVARLNPGTRHLVFCERSAEELIGERYGERQLRAFRACAVPAMQADYLRYCAIHALGGVYVDADFRCHATLDPLLAESGGTLFGRAELPPRWRTPAFEWRERVGAYRAVMNSIFAFPSAGHPLPGLALEIATANIEARVAEDVALVTGPAIFTALYLLRELGSFESFLAYARGGALEGAAPLLCETVGRYERIERAFAGVRLRSEPESHGWLEGGGELPYKATEDHWLNVKSSIYTQR